MESKWNTVPKDMSLMMLSHDLTPQFCYFIHTFYVYCNFEALVSEAGRSFNILSKFNLVVILFLLPSIDY